MPNLRTTFLHSINANGESSFEICQLFCVLSVVCTSQSKVLLRQLVLHDILQDLSMKDGRLGEMT